MNQQVPENSHPPTQKSDGSLAEARPPHLVSAAVVSRFLMRLAILAGFAALGTHGYGRSLETMLELAALYCGIVGSLRREQPFGSVLTNFDESAAYALIVWPWLPRRNAVLLQEVHL